MADALMREKDAILAKNAKDLERAKAKGTSKAMLDRLALNEGRIAGMAEGLVDLTSLPDPVGEVVSMWVRPNGLRIGQQRVPMGVVGIIYEARPNVTADAIGLCIKSGNAVILRGGSEAIDSNIAIVRVMEEAANKAGLPAGAIQLIDDTSREATKALMRMNGVVDVPHPPRRRGMIRVGRGERHGAGDRDGPRGTAMRGRAGRLRHGQGHRHRHEDPAGPPSATRARRCWSLKTSPKGFCPAAWRRCATQGRGPGLPRDEAASALGHPRDRRGLRHELPRLHTGRKGR